MRRRVILAHVAVVAVVLLILELPLGLTFARHEHDSLRADVQRDATSLAMVAEEVVENPGGHDVGTLARQFGRGSDGRVVMVDAAGRPFDPDTSSLDRLSPTLSTALDRARQGVSTAGRGGGETFAAEPIGPASELHGSVLVTHSETATEQRIDRLWLVLAVIAVVVLAVAALVGDRLALWALRPLRRLDERAATLGGGDLSARVEPVAGPPEVLELTGTFNEMAARIEELVGSQRRFVAEASHQLRSPLTALRLRLDAVDLSDRDAAAADIEAAITETMRLSRLVDGLLALVRAEDTKVERKPVDVAAVVDERRDAWSALAEERGVELRTDTPAEPVIVPLVEGHLEQILDNLVDNAIDAMTRGHAVTMAVMQTADAVEVHVVDEGPGMDSADLDHAFERFWQGNRGRRSGTGLGLPIVAQLARLNRGDARLVRAPTGGIDAIVAFRPQR